MALDGRERERERAWPFLRQHVCVIKSAFYNECGSVHQKAQMMCSFLKRAIQLRRRTCEQKFYSGSSTQQNTHAQYFEMPHAWYRQRNADRICNAEYAMNILHPTVASLIFIARAMIISCATRSAVNPHSVRTDSAATFSLRAWTQ